VGGFILRFAPETKGLDLSQINREAWRGRRKLKAALFSAAPKTLPFHRYEEA